MVNLDPYERLRRAAVLLATQGTQAEDGSLLFHAWDYLKSLCTDDFPVEMRPEFNFLQHEFRRAESEELSSREVAFLVSKVLRLESMWNGSAEAGRSLLPESHP